MKEIMTRAWEIAKEAVKKFGGKVKEYIAVSLKMSWSESKNVIKPINERIEELLKLGFSRWTKGNIDRLYINASPLGLICEYYKTGSIRRAEFCGQSISNSEARRMKNSKTFIDIKTGDVYSDNYILKNRVLELAKLN